MKRKDAKETIRHLLNDAELSLHLVATKANFYKWLQSNSIEDAYIEWLNLGVNPNDHEAFRKHWYKTQLEVSE